MNALWSGDDNEGSKVDGTPMPWQPTVIEGGSSDAAVTPRAGHIEGRVNTEDDADAALIRDAQNGDGLAVAELYRRHASLVLGYMRANGNRDAEDATADVFLSVIRGLKSFEGDSAAFRRWMMTIAHHRMIDGRRQATRRSVECAYDEHVVELDAARSSISLNSMIIDEELVRALRTITAEQREVVGLRFIADLSLQDVAHITGRTETAIKALQRRGLAALRRAMVPHAGSSNRVAGRPKTGHTNGWTARAGSQ